MKTMILALAALCSLAFSLHAGPLDSWTSRTSGTTNTLYGATFANGTFVAVGNPGTILTSSDGVSWSSQNSGTTNALLGITFGVGTWVATGANGTILTSTNLLSWANWTSGTTNFLGRNAYANGTFVVLGFNNATILTSSDATHWTIGSTGTTNHLQNVAYGNGTFAAVGRGGVIMTSPDAITWTSQSSGTTIDLPGFAFGNGQFVASGDLVLLTSAGGVTWASQNSGATSELSGMGYGSGTFVGVGSASGNETVIDTSPDGANWTIRVAETGPGVRGVAYGAGTFVAVGNSGTILQSGDTTFTQQLFLTSLQPNGLLTWTNAPGTNAFAVQGTPALTGSWSNAAPPLDLIVSTNAQTTVSVSIVPPTSFYRVAEGFGPQSLHGAWVILAAGITNTGRSYFMADGNGTLTNFGLFNLATPPGYYSVSNAGGVLLTTDTLTHGTQPLTGQFMPPRQIVFTGLSTNFAAQAMPVADVTLCAGTWIGTLSETNDPNGLSDYSVSLTVASNGSAILSGSFSGTGWMFALAPENGALSAFFKTTRISSDPYNQIQLNGTLTGNTITGSFTTDSGSGANAVVGTMTLTR
jgi:hypothetical protein